MGAMDKWPDESMIKCLEQAIDQFGFLGWEDGAQIQEGYVLFQAKDYGRRLRSKSALDSMRLHPVRMETDEIRRQSNIRT